MVQIGSYDAKTRLPELLREVEKGQSFVITNRGRAIAVLGPMPAEAATNLAQAIFAMQAFVDARPVADAQTEAFIERGQS